MKPADIVVMDYLSSYKDGCVGGLNAAAQTQLRYLPPFRSDLNPIEQVFSKIKQLLRTLARLPDGTPVSFITSRRR